MAGAGVMCCLVAERDLTSPRCRPLASGGASHSLALEAAVQSAREGGHLFIAAAGNMGSSTLFCNI